MKIFSLKTPTLIGLLAIITVFVGGCATQADNENTQIQFGVQLHSVKDQLTQDFEGTLKELAKAGVEGVEFAGRYGPYHNDPHGLRRFLNQVGLKVAGAHAPTSALRGKQGKKNLAFYRDIGAKVVIIPHDARINNPNKIDELYTELRALNSLANSYGLLLGYHNHSKEFELYQGKTYWEHLALNTPENFVLQLDVGWANFVKQQPTDLIAQFSNRTRTTHYKIRTYKGKPSVVTEDAAVLIGHDDYDWQTLYEANKYNGGTRWIIVEQEEYPRGLSPLESLLRSYAGLKDQVKS